MSVREWGLKIGACLAAVASLVSCGQSQSNRPTVAEDEPARPVRVVQAAPRPMAQIVAVTGTLEAQERSTISAKVPGRLERLAVDIGSTVKAGDLLARIEPRDYELRVQQARAALAQTHTMLGLEPEGDEDAVDIAKVNSVRQAKAVLDEASKNRERVQNLSKQGIAPQSELDTAEAAYIVALAQHETAMEEARTRLSLLAQRRAEYDSACKQLSDTAILAPFDGAVQARPGNLGEFIAAGAPVVQVVKTDPLRLRLRVPERNSPLVRAGQLVRLTVDGDTNVYVGKIARISPALDEFTRMLIVEADVPARGALRPGSFVRADIVVDESAPGLGIPDNALVTFAGVEKVVLVANGKALERQVSTGRRGPDWVEIVAGLKAGDAVVLDPGGLRTGQKVVISEGAANAAGEEQTAAYPTANPLP